MLPSSEGAKTDAIGVPPGRIPTGFVIVGSVLLALVSGYVSFIAVVLAAPGTGKIGRMFAIVGFTFLIGNVASFIYGVYSCFHRSVKRQMIGLLIQFLTVPICFATAILLIMIFGNDT